MSAIGKWDPLIELAFGDFFVEQFEWEHHRANKTGWIKILFQGAAQIARDALLDQSGTESAAYRRLNQRPTHFHPNHPQFRGTPILGRVPLNPNTTIRLR